MPRFPHHHVRRVGRAVVEPVQRFLALEAAGGIVLLVAVVVALVWAASPWATSYEDLWATDLSFTLGPIDVHADLRHWIDDGLMTLFFFVIGLEIKRELVVGRLATWRAAAVPAVGAIGGMVAPALIYVALNAGGPGADGWGIPMATDVAFAAGVLALLGSRVPSDVGVLLLGLAIVDDIGAIVVIAAFYSSGIEPAWALAAVAGLAVVVGLRRLGVTAIGAYVAVGVVVWFATWESGIHATIAGVALGLLAPARPLPGEPEGAPSVADRLVGALHPWTTFVVVPLFALANAGIEVTGSALADAASSTVTIGVALGLVVGKLVGVSVAIGLAVRFGLGRLPDGVRAAHVVGMAALAGIGFTVALFVAGLAFDDPTLADDARIGILGASVAAAALGASILVRASTPASDPTSAPEDAPPL